MTTDDVMVRRLHLMRLEHLAAETVSALLAAGVDVLLIKGPVTNAWLYGGADARAFRDVDLLLRPSHLALANEALAREGFTDLHARLLPLHRPAHERTWTRRGLLLDAHTSLAGIPAARADAAFQVLWEGREPFALQGVAVPAMAEPARAMHLALHAAQSRSDLKALRDLERGLTGLSPPVWARAAALAGALRCDAAFVVGLRTVDGGGDVVSGLGLRPRLTIEVLLRSGGASIEAQNLWEAASSGSSLRILRLLLDVVRPPGGTQVSSRTRLSAGVRLVVAVAEVAVAGARAQQSAMSGSASRRSAGSMSSTSHQHPVPEPR